MSKLVTPELWYLLIWIGFLCAARLWLVNPILRRLDALLEVFR